MNVDLIVIGYGPAGLTSAAIYAVRAGLSMSCCSVGTQGSLEKV